MRNTLTISAAALIVAALATPGFAQSSGPRGFSGPANNGISQRSLQAPSRNFSGQRLGASSFQNRGLRRVQPPSPGSQASAGTSRRSFRIQPPAPGNGRGNGAPVRSFRIQPPAPGDRTAGNLSGTTRRSFGVQPPAPTGTNPRSAQPSIGTPVRPPIAAPVIPSATTAAAVGTLAVAGTPSSASGAPTPTETAVIGQPIEPTAGEATTTADNATPPIEMLASVGRPIMPVAEAPTSTTPVASIVRTGSVTRIHRRVVVRESCGVPVHHRHHYGYRH